MRRAKQRGAGFAGFLALGAAAYWHRLQQHVWYWELSPEQFRDGLVAAPPWFLEALRAVPRQTINESQREDLRRDGAVKIEGLIPDIAVLDHAIRALGTEKGKVENNWMWNGVMYGLVKYGPLAELAASALDIPEVTIWNAQLEPRPGKAARTWPLKHKPWYDTMWGDVRDQSVHEDTDAFIGMLHKAGHFAKPQASIFLALTDLPHGLEMMAGSHVVNQEMHCRREGHYLDPDCMDRLEQACHGVRWWDLARGDAILFYGSTFHWTVLQEQPRLAISIRYTPADMLYTGLHLSGIPLSYMPEKCGPLGSGIGYPILTSNDSSRVQTPPWPLWPKRKDLDRVYNGLYYFWSSLNTRCGPIYDW